MLTERMMSQKGYRISPAMRAALLSSSRMYKTNWSAAGIISQPTQLARARRVMSRPDGARTYMEAVMKEKAAVKKEKAASDLFTRLLRGLCLSRRKPSMISRRDATKRG